MTITATPGMSHSQISRIFSCPGSYALRLLHADDAQAPATYFELGDAVHSVIESSILDDLDLAQALALVGQRIADWMAQVDTSQVLTTRTRDMDTMQADAERMIRNFYRFVMPGSPDRLPIYDEYQWPPRLEVEFERDTDTGPIRGRIDAVFEAKDGSHFAIVDWKSGTRRIQRTDQLGFYRFGLDLPEARAWFHMLDRTRRDSIIDEAETYREPFVMQRIVAADAIKAAILAGEYPRFLKSRLCDYCTVAGHCPIRGDRATREANFSRLRVDLRSLATL